MNHAQQARRAYGAARTGTITPRTAEYDAFARVTARLDAPRSGGAEDYPQLAGALHDNCRLWLALARDLVSDGNRLPEDVRLRLIALAGFVQTHTAQVLRDEAEAAPLIDVNRAIMRGLSSERQVA